MRIKASRSTRYPPANRAVRFALEVWSSDFDQTLATCLRAEALGFDAFYYGESPTGLNLECWTTLAALAQVTRRIRLGPVITNLLAGYRSVALLGKQAATVAAISQGRLDFRTGVGATPKFARAWWQPFGVHYGDYEERLADLSRALPLLQAFWTGEAVEFVSGQEAALGFACPPIPITLAATGERAMRLAAEHAQIWETSYQTPEQYAGRTAKFVGDAIRSLEVDGFVGSTDASVAAGTKAAKQQRQLEDVDALFDRSLVGVPSQIAEKIRRFEVAGVQQLLIALHDPHDVDALDALGEAIRRFRR